MLFTPEHDQFRASVRKLVEEEINPYADKWEDDEIFPAHELFPKLGAIGAFGLEYEAEFGGGGADHSFTVVLAEELGHRRTESVLQHGEDQIEKHVAPGEKERAKVERRQPAGRSAAPNDKVAVPLASYGQRHDHDGGTNVVKT